MIVLLAVGELQEQYQLIAHHHQSGGLILVVAWQSWVRDEHGNVNEAGEVYDAYHLYDHRNGAWLHGEYKMKLMRWTHLGWEHSDWTPMWQGPVASGIVRRIPSGTLELILDKPMTSPYTEPSYLGKHRFWMHGFDAASGLGTWEAQE
jgi:hypothetical protein